MWILSVLGFAKNAEMKKKNPNNWEMFIIIGFNSQNVCSDFSLFISPKDFDCSEFHSLGMVMSEKMLSAGRIAGVFNI